MCKSICFRIFDCAAITTVCFYKVFVTPKRKPRPPWPWPLTPSPRPRVTLFPASDLPLLVVSCIWNDAARGSHGSGFSRAGPRRPSPWPRAPALCSFSLLNAVQAEPTPYLSFRYLVDIWVVSTCSHCGGCSGRSCARFRVHVFLFLLGTRLGADWMSHMAPLWSIF